VCVSSLVFGGNPEITLVWFSTSVRAMRASGLSNSLRSRHSFYSLRTASVSISSHKKKIRALGGLEYRN